MSIVVVDHIVSSLNAVAAIVDNQVSHGVPRDDALRTVCANMLQQIENTGHFTNPDADRILSAIADGPWTESHATMLACAVTSIRTPSERVQVKRPPSQKCLHFERFLTDADWSMMSTQTVEHAVQCTIASRACKLNLRNGCEHTLNRMVKVVAVACKWEWSTQHRVTQCKIEIKQLIKAGSSDPRLPRLTL